MLVHPLHEDRHADGDQKRKREDLERRIVHYEITHGFRVEKNSMKERTTAVTMIQASSVKPTALMTESIEKTISSRTI